MGVLGTLPPRDRGETCIFDPTEREKQSMAKDRNTFIKVQREMEKKRKADEKRARRRKKKEEASGAGEPDIANPPTTEDPPTTEE